jgi:LmbE family N-acetylglucosaminyl deacetylase
VLGPHTDDCELGCGGMVARRIELGDSVKFLTFSSCKDSVPEGMSKNTLINEMKNSVVEIGLDPDKDVILLDFQVRTFPQYRQSILNELINIRKDYKPDIIFCPSLNDIHQDHSTVAKEALRAFKKQSVLCYEEPWNNITFSTNAFEKIESRHLESKISALSKYKSQVGRTYFDANVVRSLATMRGSQLDGGYAEAFEVIRWML